MIEYTLCHSLRLLLCWLHFDLSVLLFVSWGEPQKEKARMQSLLAPLNVCECV